MRKESQRMRQELIDWISTIKDPSTLEAINVIRNQPSSSTEYNLTSQEVSALEEGFKDLKNDDVISHKDVMKKNDQ